MKRRLRPAALALIAGIGLLLAAACTDSVARIDDIRGEPPPAAELNARLQAWREGLESLAVGFRTTYFEPDDSIRKLTTGEFRIHVGDRWLWSSSIREQSSPGSLPSNEPDYLAIADGRAWQSFDPDEGWFAADRDNEVDEAYWEIVLLYYGAYFIDVEPFPDDAEVREGELDGRFAWLVEYDAIRPGGTSRGSGPDGDYEIELRRDDLVRVYVDPDSGAPLRRLTESRQWDGDEDRAQFRDNWSFQIDFISWNSDPPPPVIAPVLSEDEARRIALPNRYREPEQRQPAQAADAPYPADEGEFSLDEVRSGLVRWVGGLDAIRTRVERREYEPVGELASGADSELALDFRERWIRKEWVEVEADDAPLSSSWRLSLGTAEDYWETADPDLGWWRGEGGYPGWRTLVEALVEAIGIDFDLARAEYRASARLDDGRGYIAFFVPQDPSSRSARGGDDGGPAREYRSDDTIHVYFDPETGAPESVDVYRLEWDVQDRSGARDKSIVTKYRVLEWNTEIERPVPEPEISWSEYQRLIRERDGG